MKKYNLEGLAYEINNCRAIIGAVTYGIGTLDKDNIIDALGGVDDYLSRITQDMMDFSQQQCELQQEQDEQLKQLQGVLRRIAGGK